MERKRWSIDPFKNGNIWGYERSDIFSADGSEKYLGRYILYISGYTLRLHKFYVGDDDRAPHDHPWPFITFPFVTYEEDVPNKYGTRVRKTVKGWRFHFRPAEYRHIVKGRVPIFDPVEDARLKAKHGIPGYDWLPVGRYDTRPFWTFVMTGRRQRTWGFWPRVDKFIDWRLW